MGKTAKCCKREVAVYKPKPHYERAALWEDRGNKVDKLIYTNDPGGAWRFSNKELSHFLTWLQEILSLPKMVRIIWYLCQCQCVSNPVLCGKIATKVQFIYLSWKLRYSISGGRMLASTTVFTDFSEGRRLPGNKETRALEKAVTLQNNQTGKETD